MRKIISFLLSITLLLGLAMPAMAATVKQEIVDSLTEVTAGDTVQIDVTLDEAVTGIATFEYRLYYNPELFELASKSGTVDVTNNANYLDPSKPYIAITKCWDGENTFDIAAGVIASVVFKAKVDISSAQEAGFELLIEAVDDPDFNSLVDEFTTENSNLTITVNPEIVETYYTVSLPENPVGYTITPVAGSASPVVEGGSYSFTVTVDTENYEGTPVVKANGINLTPSDGVYTIANITEDQTVTVEGLQEQGVAADRVIYQNGSNGAQWPSGTPVFINTVTLKGVSVTDVAWDASYETCTITLHKKTAADASYSLLTTVAVNGQPTMISMFSADINGSTYSCNSFAHSGSLENGQAEIVYAAKAGNYSGTKTIKLVVDGTSVEPEPETYEVTLTQGEGYTIAAAEGSSSPVTEGGSYSFTVTVNNGYEGTPVVKVNGTELTAVDGVYTISNITEAKTVTVEGITQKVNTYTVTLTEGVGYTIAAAEGSSSPVTEGGSFSFTVTVNNGYEGTPVVKANDTELTAENGVYTIANISTDQVVTVEGIAVKANMYTITASADVTVSKGETAAVSVSVTGNSNEQIVAYNDYDVTVSYDPAVLTYASAVAAHSGAEITADAEAGTVRIVGHGEAKQCTDAVVTLNFTALASGIHDVTITTAKIDNSGNAIALDAPEAALSDKTTAVKVAYPVTLPDNFTGDLKVLPGGDYEFTAPNEHYEITVMVGGEEVTPNVDGLVYTIYGVNGDVVITAVGKTYKVTKNGENVTIDGADTAQYGADYSFTVTADSGYSVANVSVKVGDAAVDYTISGGKYIISGSKITGDVTVTVTTQQAVNTTQITFEGVDASEVVGGLVQYAANGQDFRFELNEEEGYVYTAKLGEEVLKPAEGVYIIPGTQINGTALTVVITKEVYSFHPEVTVRQYIQLDKTVMWLVTATEGDTVLAYGEGNTMFWSDKYNAYCWLVVSSESEEAVKQVAEDTILAAAEDALATNISYDFDVNQTGAVDINDAQLTYDMYQAKLYADFDTVSMDKFLEADTNGDAVVNVEDAAAVVAQLLK